MNDRSVSNNESRQYREQYINDNSVTTLRDPTFIDSFASDSLISLDTRSILTTRTTLLTPDLNRSLPDVETTRFGMNSSQMVDPTLDSSILVRTYLRQEKQSNRV